MYKIRQISYAPNSISVQVYKIENRKRVIVKHIGSSKTKQELEDLLIIAQQFITNLTQQVRLFETGSTTSLLNLNQTEFIGVYYRFVYETLSELFKLIGIKSIVRPLLLDLAIIRIVEPASKLRSIALIEDYFGIKHRRQSYYDSVNQWSILKDKIERKTVAFAKDAYDFNYNLLFYDVTTLYFETFSEDDLRKNGFSKDNKSQQPQILVALLVTKEGFPIGYEIFPGNTFEGHTIIPVVKKFIAKHKVKSFTIVADAAMISKENIANLKAHGIHYIVGARMGNLPLSVIDQIDQTITREDGKSIRIPTAQGDLICSYSNLRCRKDDHEMQKQIEKAKYLINNPGKRKKLKYTKAKGETIELNQKLIDKTKKTLGIKGYYTDLKEQHLANNIIIERYHELYKIEQAFRVSKHDLKTRPIFHYKRDPIQLHTLICFMALVVAKHIELQTKLSIKEFIYLCKKVTDARMLDKINNKQLTIRAKISPELQKIIAKLNLLT